MANKSIVILSDGTGNSAAKLFKTNVWRVGEALDLTKGDQIYVYDDGVGTERFKPLAMLGGAVGLGLQQNVRQLYAFLCRNYQPGDDIYMFGFSRGAFTLRVLIGLIHGMGLVSGASEGELQQNVRHAFKEYRSATRPIFNVSSQGCWAGSPSRPSPTRRRHRSASSACGTPSMPMACRSRS